MVLAALGQIAGVVVGVSVLGGVTIAIIGKEITNENQTLFDKTETGLIRLGYVTEGIAKGAIVSVPPCLLALLLLNYTLKAQTRIVGDV